MEDKVSRLRQTLTRFIKDNRWILIAMLLLLAERLVALWQLGPMYTLDSDDASYVISGIEFANTGTITMHGVLSAQIMPGMPVLIGFFSLLFGEGLALWTVLKIVWILMGVFTAFYIYKSIAIFAPKWIGALCAFLFMAMPNIVWMDNLILTETPFMLFFTMMIYSTLMMGKTRESKYFWMCLVTYFLALMMKANIGIYPVFAFIYLCMAKYGIKKLLKQGLIIACVLLCFIVPWSIRNYIHYDAFIPLTYGAGNPMLLGTYQGVGYPADEDLDYETNVKQVVREKYARYYDENGKNSEPYLYRYILLEEDGVKAKYRMQEWAKRDPVSMAKSYLYGKPRMMIFGVFYWKELFGIPYSALRILRALIFGGSIVSFLLACFQKKHWKEMIFLALVYLGNIYVYAMSFAFDRYSETLMPAQYIACGIGLFLFIDWIQAIVRKKKAAHAEKDAASPSEAGA